MRLGKAMRVSGAGWLAVMLLGAGGDIRARPGGCASPPDWSAAEVRPGSPDRALSACLRSQAYKARGLHIPVDNVANGIVASCEVQVSGIEGSNIYDDPATPAARRQAIERDAMRQATAAVTLYRSCAAR
jgi:hypothetical protein